MSEHEREAYQTPRCSLLFTRRGGFVNNDEHADDEDDADCGDQNGNDCQYYQDSIHRSPVPHDQGAKDFLNTRSHTRCPSLRPRVSNFVSGREPALAKSEAVLISEGSDKNTSSICRAYSSQSVQAWTMAPGFIFEASSAANGAWMRRRLWWRFFGQGSGKKMCTPSSASGAIMCCSTSTASCWMTRTFARSSSATRFKRLPTPGVCTSTPR